ncbi:hypothetical protein O181_005789 [Austropuccinia psidii MF-1]|uniref:Reverse transcriptase domain-containing protein n=1 Tax=Austropuccinia psidii MF-1 TaxID=1389203 RepID=A0A9Q3GG81_9BASI|nr:hypothetical protein [Austropuccinia psidii MF-1]
MDCMKGFHQNRVKPNSTKLLRIICHMGIYEYPRLPFGIKNAPAHFQRMMDTIFQEEILEGWIWPLGNVKRNPAYDPEVAAEIPTHFMEIDRKKNFRFSEWEAERCTPDSGNTSSEGTETPILGMSSSELQTEFFNEVMKTYAKHNKCSMLLQLLHKNTGAQN